MKKILAILLAVAMVAVLLAGCTTDPGNTSGNGSQSNTGNTSGNGSQSNTGNTSEDKSQDNTTPTETVYDKYTHDGSVNLKMAFGYNSTDAAISFNANIISQYGEGETITLANGQSYRAGELKPTWQTLEERLGITVTDVYQGNSASGEWSYWENQLDQLQVIYGSLATLNNAGLAGSLVNLTDYLELMPNFKAYLDANPIVYASITADPDAGDIYFSPYFDGADDIERMPLMRTDWVEKLLNGEGEFTATASKSVTTGIYTPYMPTSGKVTVDVVKADASGTETVTKDYDTAGNIVEKMNAAGSLDGVAAVNMLRTYIDEAYGGYYGTNRADLFIGQNAAWDADELVALLRCVVANPQTLNGTDKVYGIFAREDNNMQRKVDTYRLAAILFGVRGLESRSDYLFIDSEGKLHDARQEVSTYEAMDRMHAMALEGLISESYLKNEAEKTETMLENDLGFMHYDYNQTQTIYNETKLDAAAGEKYRAVLVPVARWNDGTGEQFFRFTESWRSVKDTGIAITKAGVAGNDEALYAALALIDYAFSKEGQILMSYGPDEFIKTNADGSYVTFNFNGEEWPEIADATREELWSKANGNYTNYARYFLGSTLTFLKSQAFESQCTADAGREGATLISNAIALDVIKHPELAFTKDNYWYTNVPSTLPITEQQSTVINGYTDLTGNSGKFGTSKDSVNEFVDIIINGYSGDVVTGVTNAQEAAAQAANDFNGTGYLAIEQQAWDWVLSTNG